MKPVGRLRRVRPLARNLWSCRAVVAAIGLVAFPPAAAPLFAGAIPTSRSSNFFAEAVATVTKASNDRQSDFDFPPPTTGFGPVSGMEDVSITHSQLPGLTASGNTQQNSTITLDPAGNLLSAQGSVSAHAEASQPDHLEPPQDPQPPPSVNNVRADATLASGMTLVFNVTRAGYEYSISGSASAMASLDTEYADGRALGDLGLASLSGGGTLFLERRSPEQGNSNVGSTTGPLPPGMYVFVVSASAEGHVSNHRFLPRPVAAASAQGTASANGQLTLTPPIFWIDAVNGNFGDGGRWSTGQSPAAGENAVIDQPGSYTVTLDSNETHKGLHFNGAGVNATLDVNGFDYVLDEISIGGVAGDNVSVTFSDSTLPVAVVSAAAATAAGGLLPPASHASPARIRAHLLKAGEGGKAVVDIPITTTNGLIDKGGRVDVEGTNGEWTVTNLSVGTDDEATLKIFDRGRLITTRATVGDNRFSDASVEMTGENSLASANASWTTDRLVVGNRGEGAVSLAARAKLIGDDFFIAEQPTSIGRITLDRASLTGNAPLPGFSTITVGGAGLGTLEVKNESLVDVDNLHLGISTGSSGRVAVESFSKVMASGEIRVGGGGAGNFTIDGGEVQQTDVFGLTQIGPNGLLQVLSGHFYERRRLFVNGDLLLDTLRGSAAVGLTILRLPGTLVIGDDGILFGNGTIFGDVRVLTGGDDQFGGTLAPSTSPGTLTIDGDYQQDGGTLQIEIAGTAPGEFDVLKVTGNADILGGDLLLHFLDGFAPQQGDEFMFLDVAGALAGQFANIQLRGLRPGFQFDLRPAAGGLTMIALNDGLPVPEPASIALLLAVVLLAPFRRLASHPLAVRPRAHGRGAV